MSKLIGETIKVRQNRNSAVTAFIWRKRFYRIEEVLGWWREPADWWMGKTMPLFVRVNARNTSPGTYELCKLGDEWLLNRVLD